MNPRWKVALGLTSAVVGSAVVAVAAGSGLWDRATARAVGRLSGPSPLDRRAAFALEDLEGLPDPVARYFRFALTPGQPLVRRVRIEHAGTFAMKPDRWVPFTSVQHVAVRPPGFVWDARIRMVPGLSVRVRDSYLGGEGRMYGALAGLVPLVDQRGEGPLAEASLMRYLAEAAWYPTALLPAGGVTWTAVDGRTALATLRDGGVSASVTFHFGPAGEIARITADRYRDVNGTLVRTPWEGAWRAYERRGTMMIPAEGEVVWLTPEGRHTYWRGRVVETSYDYGIPSSTSNPIPLSP